MEKPGPENDSGVGPEFLFSGYHFIKPTPISGSFFAPLFETSVMQNWVSMQVMATWKWWNYLKATAPVGKRFLTINLDETYVAYYQGGVCR